LGNMREVPVEGSHKVIADFYWALVSMRFVERKTFDFEFGLCW
jgi:hypothetical protein